MISGIIIVAQRIPLIIEMVGLISDNYMWELMLNDMSVSKSITLGSSYSCIQNCIFFIVVGNEIRCKKLWIKHFIGCTQEPFVKYWSQVKVYIREWHDDVIKWKRVPRYWPFVGHRWLPLTKASCAELWCFLWSAIETLVIWDAIALIMKSKQWNGSLLVLVIAWPCHYKNQYWYIRSEI